MQIYSEPSKTVVFGRLKTASLCFRLQTVSLGHLVVRKTTVPDAIGLHRLTKIPTIENLVFEGNVPSEVSILDSLVSIRLESAEECLDLGVLKSCGPRLECIHITSSKGAGDGFVTINGLSSLPGLRKFRFLNDFRKFSDVSLIIGKGWGSIKSFAILTQGRLRVNGEREGFEQFWEKISSFRLRYGVWSDGLTDPSQSGLEMMLAAGRARGLDVRGHQHPRKETHPVLGSRGVRFQYNVWSRPTKWF